MSAPVTRPALASMLRAFREELSRERGPIALSYALSIVTILGWIATPWPLKIIIDDVLGGRALPVWLRPAGDALGPRGLVVALAGAFLAATAVAAMAAALERRVTARVRERLGIAIRDRVMGHLQTLPPTLRRGHRSGELVFRLVNDVDTLVRLFTKTTPLLVRYGATALFTCAGMLWISPSLGAITAALVPALWVVVRRYGPRLAAASRDKRAREGEVAAFAQEVVRGLPVLQALGADRPARLRFGRINAESLRAGVRESRLTAGMEQGLEIARGVAISLVIGGGGLFVLGGKLTVGALTVLAAYVTQLLKPIDKVNDLAEATSRGLAAGGRLMALLDQEPLVRDAPDAADLPRCRGVLELSSVTFAYPDAPANERPVLSEVSLRLEPGELAVLIGRSGAGKSTLLSLLVRLFDPLSGEIRLDGIPYRRLRLSALRSRIAIMTQDLHLFAGSLREALMPPGVRPSDDRVWDALELVALAEFVRALPGGLDAVLVEDGSNLSGGQRQRLSLARAILTDRPILLLDEPLANVDDASAAVILRALERLKRTRACLAITHQPSMLVGADVVYRLECGRIRQEPPRLRPPAARAGA